MDGLLDERLLDIIDHHIQSKRLVVNKQPHILRLLSRDTSRVQQINISLLSQHRGIGHLRPQLDVGATVESLIVIGIEGELVGLLLELLGRLSRVCE